MQWSGCYQGRRKHSQQYHPQMGHQATMGYQVVDDDDSGTEIALLVVCRPLGTRWIGRRYCTIQYYCNSCKLRAVSGSKSRYPCPWCICLAKTL